jgi:hypothetical protein
MTPRYPGHDPDASAQQLRWRSFETRFDAPDAGRVLPPTAHRLAPAPPDELRSPFVGVLPPGTKRPGLTTACGPNAAARKKRTYRKRAEHRDKATCPHDQGWQGNGNATQPGKKREQCRACGLNRSIPAEAA